MTELELKSQLVDYLHGIVDGNVIEVLLGTPDSAAKHNLVNAHGCILVGSAGSPVFTPKISGGERLYKHVDYHQAIQLVITVGYLTINDNVEQHDELVDTVLRSITNLVHADLPNPIMPTRITEPKERDGAIWTQLYFNAAHRLKVANHVI